LPPFPIEQLPLKLACFVRELARFSETDPGLAGVLVLAAVAACIAGKAKVQPKADYVEPLNIMVLLALRPGERKSSVFSRVLRALEAREKELQEDAREEIAEIARRREELEERLGAAQRAARKQQGTSLDDVESLRAELAALPPGTLPRLLADDATPECIAPLMASNGGCLCVASAEGGIIAILRGRYAQGMPNIDVFLKGHAGDTIRVDRRNADSIVIHDPALTVALAVQPDVVSELLTEKQFRGRGLVARFLFALPTPRAGTRKIDVPPIAEAIANEYDATLRRLLLLPRSSPAPHLLFGEDAWRAWLAFACEIDSKIGDSGELASIVDWGSKLGGAVARLAGILHLAEHAWDDDPLRNAITAATVERAIELGRYFLAHAQVVLGATPPNERMLAAEALLKWINGRPSFSVREVQRGSQRFGGADDIRATLAVLEEHGYVRRREPPLPSRGRPARDDYDVHPLLHADRTAKESESQGDPPPV
jgi:hypothetical protein